MMTTTTTSERVRGTFSKFPSKIVAYLTVPLR